MITPGLRNARSVKMSDLRELVDELDFEQWLDSEGVTYRRGSISSRGREVNIRVCPCCGSAKWKVYFNVTTGVGTCFAGDHPEDVQFNKVNFIKYHTSKTWRGLQSYLEKELLAQGWQPKREIVMESTSSLSVAITLPASYELPIEGRLPDYLVKRHITPEMARYFDLRYCVEGEHVYTDLYTRRSSAQSFDMRIILPVYDLNGVMKTFQGRDITGASQRRYLFPITLPAAGKYLYNGHNAIGKRTVVVGEGAFDVMGIKRALFNEETLRDYVEPVGTFGKHLSGTLEGDNEDQLSAFLKLKHAGLETVVMMWDSEKQAIDSMMSAARKLVGIGLKVKIASLGKEGLDPGDAEPEHILKAYYRAKPYSRHLEMKAKLLGISVLS